MQDLFIGVDGGGTKTEAVIQDANGQTLGVGLAGSGNIRTSVAQSWNSVNEAIANAATQAAIKLNDYKLHVGLGMAGSELSTAVTEFLNVPHPFTTLSLNSDAHIACLGVHGGADGAIIIVGTGVIGYQILHDKTYRSGGYGFPHSDEGGGAWLGMELFRLAFKAIDERITWTPMLRDVYKQFQNTRQNFADYANTAKPSDYAKFASFVFQYKDTDTYAKKLLAEAAFEIDQIYLGLLNQSKHNTFTVGLLGGLAPLIQPYVSESLKKHIVERKFNAPVGAIMMVKQQLGISK